MGASILNQFDVRVSSTTTNSNQFRTKNQKFEIDKVRAGVLVGTGMGRLTVFSDGVQALIEKGHKRITPFFIPYVITNMASVLLAINLGLMGPNYSIHTTCATSNYCFYTAANHIYHGEADLMIAGGTEATILPIGLGGLLLVKLCYREMVILRQLQGHGTKPGMAL